MSIVSSIYEASGVRITTESLWTPVLFSDRKNTRETNKRPKTTRRVPIPAGLNLAKPGAFTMLRYTSLRILRL